MEPTETSPLLVFQSAGSSRKASAINSIKSDIKDTTEDVARPSDEEIGSQENAEPKISGFNLRTTIPVLLLGVFFASADMSLVFATKEIISSEFGDLANSGWLVTSFALAMCAVQPLYGKLSDIFGRKPVLIASYLIFSLGCAICGAGGTLWWVVVGRAIGGIGGAGMASMVSIIITDLVPLKDVASWRSYVNIAATTGRSLGGPLGGYLADTIGWRWSFYGQCPPMLLAAGLVFWKLPSTGNSQATKMSIQSKFKRIDFMGAVLLAGAIICFMFVLSLGGQTLPWTGPTVITLIAVSLLLGSAFLLVEAYWAQEPIFPLRLIFHRDVLVSYLIAGLQIGAQSGVMFAVPLYFQVSAHASAMTAGAHLFPAVAGNATGMLLTGLIIKKTGRYKLPTILGAMIATIGYALLVLRWHGNTGIFESLYIVPGGFGTGVVLSTTFIGLAASVDASDIAIAGTGLYQSQNIGATVGLTITSSLIQNTLRPQLEDRLQGVRNLEEIVAGAMSDIDYVQSLTGTVGEVVVECYVSSLTYTHGASLIAAAMTFFFALLMREHEL